jgi:DNA-binding transcriptional regulator YhcF (GntR family)
VRIDYESIKPIYVQIAEAIEDDILSGRLIEGSPAYSQLVLAKELQVNPATAGKGINALVEKGILEKRRGRPMTVAMGAKEVLMTSRQGHGLQSLIDELVAEAHKINLSENEVAEMLRESFVCAQETSGEELSHD